MTKIELAMSKSALSTFLEEQQLAEADLIVGFEAAIADFDVDKEEALYAARCAIEDYRWRSARAKRALLKAIDDEARASAGSTRP